MAATLHPPTQAVRDTVAADIRIVDVPEVVEVVEVAHRAPDPFFPPGLASRLVLGALFMMLFTLVAVALPLWLYTGSIVEGLGVAALPAFWCGGGFGAILGAASYSATQEH